MTDRLEQLRDDREMILFDLCDAVTMSHCPYFEQFAKVVNKANAPVDGVKCQSGCWEEPACIANQTDKTWAEEAAMAAAELVKVEKQIQKEIEKERK